MEENNNDVDKLDVTELVERAKAGARNVVQELIEQYGIRAVEIATHIVTVKRSLESLLTHKCGNPDCDVPKIMSRAHSSAIASLAQMGATPHNETVQQDTVIEICEKLESAADKSANDALSSLAAPLADALQAMATNDTTTPPTKH